jgi:hypothetical protein
LSQQDKSKEVEQKETVKVAFSLPQIVGGALAAATAAAIGSQLGVAGTILGAAVASIVGGIAGTLYSAGIDRTHRKVSEAITRGSDQVRSHPDYDPDGASPALPGLGDTQRLDAADGTEVDPEPVEPDDGRRRKLWKVMGLSVAAMFVLALVAITIIELGLGRALDGKQGTTVSQVVRADPTPTPTPSRTPSASVTPTVTPTASATVQPTTPAPTATVPSETAVPSATVTVTTVPSAATTP